ncbi:MAG TPA: phage tail protein, partial [Longimicrobium sp.]
MFAQLGSVMFEVVGALTEFGGRREYSYAEHARIDGKPTVQFTGEGLEEADLGFALDEWLCEPAVALAKLQKMAGTHQAVTLIWGDGRLQGPFVL